MLKYVVLASLICALSVPAWAAKSKPSNVVIDSAALTWNQVVPGVMIAPVQGDPNKGASHFFLKYAAGLKTPQHHHTPDHYVTLLSGNMTVNVDGAEHKLSPGSFLALTNKAPHQVNCIEGADCVMSIDARGKWDVVPEKH